MPLHNKQQLLGDASQIRHETLEGHNTAERVGKMFHDIIEAFEEYFLSKIDPDTAQKLITLLEGAEFGDFVPGIFGKGGKIDGNGDAEMQSLILHRFLEVPELRYNRVSIEVGNKWRAPGGGIIESCVPDKDQDGNELMTGTITLHLEDGEIGAVAVDDICMGIFHNERRTNTNSQINYDDSIGNFRFAGFYTTYFRITEIVNQGDNSVFRYVLRPVSANWMFSFHPTEAMHFVGYGNFSDKNRQTARYSTRTYERYLQNVNDWEFGIANIAAQFGDLSNLSAFGMDMTGYSAYLNNIYMIGTIEQMEALFPRMEIDTDGDYFLAYGESLNVTCKVFRGWKDVTSQVNKWTVTRDTGDPVEDTSWALKTKVQNFNGTIEICFMPAENDLGTNSLVTSTLFTFKAELSDSTSATSTIAI